MPLQSFETSPSSVATHNGPLLEYAPRERDMAEQCLRIRARRVFSASRNDLFAAWTGRNAWESWLGFRTRSRAVVTSYSGGAFRLELAEGPIIHVITGAAREIRVGELASFTWIHHDTGDHWSTIDVAFGQRRDQSELRLVHHSIASRREAAWLMRLWVAALDRLDRCLVTEIDRGPRARELARRIAQTTEPQRSGSRVASGVAARHASSAA